MMEQSKFQTRKINNEGEEVIIKENILKNVISKIKDSQLVNDKKESPTNKLEKFFNDEYILDKSEILQRRYSYPMLDEQDVIDDEFSRTLNDIKQANKPYLPNNVYAEEVAPKKKKGKIRKLNRRTQTYLNEILYQDIQPEMIVPETLVEKKNGQKITQNNFNNTHNDLEVVIEVNDEIEPHINSNTDLCKGTLLEIHSPQSAAKFSQIQNDDIQVAPILTKDDKQMSNEGESTGIEQNLPLAENPIKTREQIAQQKKEEQKQIQDLGIKALNDEETLDQITKKRSPAHKRLNRNIMSININSTPSIRKSDWQSRKSSKSFLIKEQNNYGLSKFYNDDLQQLDDSLKVDQTAQQKLLKMANSIGSQKKAQFKKSKTLMKSSLTLNLDALESVQSQADFNQRRLEEIKEESKDFFLLEHARNMHNKTPQQISKPLISKTHTKNNQTLNKMFNYTNDTQVGVKPPIRNVWTHLINSNILDDQPYKISQLLQNNTMTPLAQFAEDEEGRYSRPKSSMIQRQKDVEGIYKQAIRKTPKSRKSSSSKKLRHSSSKKFNTEFKSFY